MTKQTDNDEDNGSNWALAIVYFAVFVYGVIAVNFCNSSSFETHPRTLRIRILGTLVLSGALLRMLYFAIPERIFDSSEVPKDVSEGEKGWALQFLQYILLFAIPNTIFVWIMVLLVRMWLLAYASLTRATACTSLLHIGAILMGIGSFLCSLTEIFLFRYSDLFGALNVHATTYTIIYILTTIYLGFLFFLFGDVTRRSRNGSTSEVPGGMSAGASSPLVHNASPGLIPSSPADALMASGAVRPLLLDGGGGGGSVEREVRQKLWRIKSVAMVAAVGNILRAALLWFEAEQATARVGSSFQVGDGWWLFILTSYLLGEASVAWALLWILRSPRRPGEPPVGISLLLHMLFRMCCPRAWHLWLADTLCLDPLASLDSDSSPVHQASGAAHHSKSKSAGHFTGPTSAYSSNTNVSDNRSWHTPAAPLPIQGGGSARRGPQDDDDEEYEPTERGGDDEDEEEERYRASIAETPDQDDGASFMRAAASVLRRD